MSLTEITVQGTLKPDGTLQLDEKPNLTPGRVQVILRTLPELPEGDPFFDMLKGIWAARASAGLTPRSEEEIKAVRQRLNEEMEEEIAEAGQLQQECRGTNNAAAAPKREAE